MARLNGQAGTTLTPPPLPPKEKPVAPKAMVVTEQREFVIEAPCDVCGHVLKGKALRYSHDFIDLHTGWRQDEDETLCKHCASILSTASGNGRTGNAKATLEKLEQVREAGMLVIMRTLSAGDNSGLNVEVEFGDVFKVRRVGADTGGSRIGREVSMKALTVDIAVGPVVLTLWPHEIAPMNLITVLALQKDGDYEMAYVSQDDQEGYFTLTPKAKDLVLRTFGKR